MTKRERLYHIRKRAIKKGKNDYRCCPVCNEPLSNWGATSSGNGDIYDEIGCDMCGEIVEEIHASYCTCIDCDPFGLKSDEQDNDEIPGDSNCPNCGNEYDEIDHEYQICHLCKYNNNL